MPMSTIIDTFLASRIHRPAPERYENLVKTPGISRAGESQDSPIVEVKAIYTTAAASEMVSHSDSFYALIDFRFIEFVSDLVSAYEIEDSQHRATGIMFTFYTAILEQTTSYPESTFQRGALLDYIVSRTSALTHWDWQGLADHDDGRLEYITKLAIAHELAHCWFKVDKPYLDQIIKTFESYVSHLQSVGGAGDLAENPIVIAANNAKTLLSDYANNQLLSSNLEEMLCDFVMVWAGAHAALKSHQAHENLYTFLGLTGSTLSALWAIPTLKQAVESISSGIDVNLDPGKMRDVRSVLALMTFLRITGEALGEKGNCPGDAIAKLWEETADFSGACVDTLNAMLTEGNVERLSMIGESSRRIELISNGETRDAILNMLKWQ